MGVDESSILRIIRPASYAWIVSDGKVLLCRLCEDHNRGQWTLPGGGLEFGEPVTLGCEREVYEETGLRVRLERILLVDTICTEVQPEIGQRELARLHGIEVPLAPAQMYSLRIVYLASVTDGHLLSETDGTTDLAQWIPLAEAANFPLVDLAKTTLAAWTSSASHS